MSRIFQKFILIAFIGIPGFLIAQQKHITLNWSQPVPVTMGYDSSVPAPWFNGAQYPALPEDILPRFSRNFPLTGSPSGVEATLVDVEYLPLNDAEKAILKQVNFPSTIQFKTELMTERHKPVAMFSMLPFATDPETGIAAKIGSFTINLKVNQGKQYKSSRTYASSSVLATGDWFKMYVGESGIYKVTYEELKNMGVNVTGLNPDMIRVFGNGGALLNEAAGTPRPDDLTENAIEVVTAVPGIFSKGDYLLFYGEGTRTWAMNPFSGRMEHTSHYYADEACYFITTGPVAGKRVTLQTPPTETPDYQTAEFTQYAVYEEDNINLIKSGRKWFANKLDYYTRTFNLPDYSFPDMILSEPVSLRYSFAGRATVQMSYSIIVNNETVATNTMAGITGSNDFARELVTSATYPASGNLLKIQVKLNPPNTTALGWLDFVAVNVRSNLHFNGGQLAFRDPRTVAPGRISRFTLNSSTSKLTLWDVSDPLAVTSVPYTVNGQNCSFVLPTSTLREVVAFDGTHYMSVRPGERVANQNLHAIAPHDMIILTHPDFTVQAERLAALHNAKGDVSAVVVQLPQVYNEFSSGIQDITAIRDFMKMLYDRDTLTQQPQYLLLFGNASYDVKNRISNNSCFIPTWQSDNSIRPVASFCTDDYFGLLDDGDGANQTTGLIDVITGRLPVRTQAQADVAVHKIETYLANGSELQGDWRNSMLLIADDQNKNLHLEQAEGLAEKLDVEHPVYNLDKIYFDAYTQQSTPGGSRYPDVNREIVTRVEKGALLVNYVGHGGEVGWADERVLEITDINSWTNFDRMGMFFTATCEFSRFDDPGLLSAGEQVFLNPEGGAMSLITTTRLAFASYNAALNLSFIDTVINAGQGVYPTLGDVLRYTKNDNQLSANNRHMTLFGDPAMQLPYPKYQVVTTAASSDTLFANTIATFEGEVRGHQQQLLSDFNGEVYVKVFDKKSKVRTLGQDNDSYPVDFMVQKSILYQGIATVTGGRFSFTFPVPRDIDYSYGKGKISYYATDGTNDAHGYYDDFIIGGSVNQPNMDTEGPRIRLFINDTTFLNGDLTSENPKLLAFLYDESGINTAGNGIGHDLVATIDGDSYSSVLLNDYYVSNRDSYQSGKIRYQYFNLPDGEHTLTLKAWDVYNNSSTASITFVVKRNILLSVTDLRAYPVPSQGEVFFSFGHNQFDATFNVEVEIYSITGELMRVLGPLSVISEGYTARGIRWDGCTASGLPVRNGLYIARLKARDRNNNTTSNTVKLIIGRTGKN